MVTAAMTAMAIMALRPTRGGGHGHRLENPSARPARGTATGLVPGGSSTRRPHAAGRVGRPAGTSTAVPVHAGQRRRPGGAAGSGAVLGEPGHPRPGRRRSRARASCPRPWADRDGRRPHVLRPHLELRATPRPTWWWSSTGVNRRWASPRIGQPDRLRRSPLGASGSGRSHAMVKCPQAWVPTFVNGGHECLLVRVWDKPSDRLATRPSTPRGTAMWGSATSMWPRPASLPRWRRCSATRRAPLPGTRRSRSRLGPLRRAGQVAVERVAPDGVPWLQQRTGSRGVPVSAAARAPSRPRPPSEAFPGRRWGGPAG